jgi:hypoxanthine phosphoribosyltransferase
MPRKKPSRPVKDVFNVDWPLFGEISRALALKVAREYDPDLVVGIAMAENVQGDAVAAMLDPPFNSKLVSRRYQAETVRETPAVFGAAPAEVRGKNVLVVDETCGSGATLRLAIASVLNAGAADVRSAVSFKTGDFQPDFFGLETESTIVLPWDKEIIVDGELLPNPKYQ